MPLDVNWRIYTWKKELWKLLLYLHFYVLFNLHGIYASDTLILFVNGHCTYCAIEDTIKYHCENKKFPGKNHFDISIPGELGFATILLYMSSDDTLEMLLHKLCRSSLYLCSGFTLFTWIRHWPAAMKFLSVILKIFKRYNLQKGHFVDSLKTFGIKKKRNMGINCIIIWTLLMDFL